MGTLLNIIIPQYHSSYCIDDCLYCGFRKNNKSIPRKRLNEEDFKKEINLLIDWGYRTIEFVYSSDRFFKPEVIAQRVEYAKKLANKRGINIRIGLNAEPFDYDGYKTLNSAGLDFFVLWMETYSREKYQYWHGTKTPKADYDYRYEAYERAIEAGISNYGMGVLLGLHDWQEEIQSLINHGNFLKKKYGKPPYIIGIPRLKQAHSVSFNGELNDVSDQEFVQITKKYKQAFPSSMLFFNTREPFDLNLKCCSNNDLFTIDCGTYPGAYLTPSYIKDGIQQFNTYLYERDKIIEQLKEHKIKPVFEW